jgi:hypothetical protein
LIDTVSSALGLFDAARGRLHVAWDALAIINVVVATETRDSIRKGGTLEVGVARISHAVTAQHFESRLALTLGIGDARSVALDKASVALAVVKTAVARAARDLARIGRARKIGA